MEQKSIERVAKKLEVYTNLGLKVLSDGTKLIGHVPHVAPGAWLHKIFGKTSEKELLSVETFLLGEIPETYASLLLQMNGLNIFSETLSLFGVRRNYDRSDPWQPFDILIDLKE